MTASLTVDGSHLLRDGNPFFLVVDTAWSAFSDAAPDEWRRYVRKRKEQGFTGIAVSALPLLHDRTIWFGVRHPFARDDHGRYDFDAPDARYLDTAIDFAAIAKAEGLVMAIVVLWCNYVDGTWASKRLPGVPTMSALQRREHVRRVTRAFAEFDPILVISGDEAFIEQEQTAVYREVLHQVAEEAPHCLTAMHSTPDADLPAEIADSPELDLYFYQSGHDPDRQDRCHDLAMLYRAKPVNRPVMNLEPVYEQHGHGHGTGRFGAAEVRRAVWWSILAGATAGIGYGAHGMWQWHRAGGRFTGVDFSSEPVPWHEALEFPGADDVVFAARLVEHHALDRLDARPDLLAAPAEGVRVGASPDGAVTALYLRRAQEVRLAGDHARSRATAWDLERRAPVVLRLTVQATITSIESPPGSGDLVIVFERAAPGGRAVENETSADGSVGPNVHPRR